MFTIVTICIDNGQSYLDTDKLKLFKTKEDALNQAICRANDEVEDFDTLDYKIEDDNVIVFDNTLKPVTKRIIQEIE